MSIYILMIHDSMKCLKLAMPLKVHMTGAQVTSSIGNNEE